jgi:hypothetical protein
MRLKSMRVTVAVVLAGFVVSAGAAPKGVALKALVLKAKENLTTDFNDPRGAQYRGLFVSQSDALSILCGEVNGKNVYGAYVGFRKFYAVPFRDGVKLVRDPADPRVFDQMEQAMCGNKIADVQ